MASGFNNTEENEVETPEEIKSITVKVRCKDCIYFKKMATYEEPCDKLGRLAQSKPCSRFAINPDDLNFGIDSPNRKLRSLLLEMKEKDFSKLAAIILQEHRTRKQNFSFGQVVYLLVGDDYVSNYRLAHVVCADNKNVLIRGAKGWTGVVQHGSIITKDKFEAIKENLIAKDRLVDPKREYNKIAHPEKRMRKPDYKPPTIDHLSKVEEREASKGSRRVRG